MSTPWHDGGKEPWAAAPLEGRHWDAAAAPPQGRRWWLIIVALLLAVVLGMSGLAVFRLQHNLVTSPLSLGDGGTEESGATDILIMGADSLSPNEEGEDASRTDVMMLAHISEGEDDVTVVSFPRDLIVDIPACTDPETGEEYPAQQDAMLNSAAENGGPGCTVAAISDLTGLSIDHFMLADYGAVEELSRTVGGVEVCVTHPVDDPKSGLVLPAGTSTVEGDMALAFLRSRAAFGDGGDQSRIRSQQQFLASLVRKIKAEGTLTNIPRLYEIADVMTRNLHVDSGLGNVARIVELAGRLADVDLSRVVFVQAPTEPHPEDPNRLQLQEEPAQELFQVLREDGSLTEPEPEPTATSAPESAPSSAAPAAPAAPAQETQEAAEVAPETVPVAVSDASGREGRGAEVLELLQDAGYTAAAEGAAIEGSLSGTQLYYGAGWEGAAEQLAQELGIPDAQVVYSPEVLSGLSLVVGEDFAEGEAMETGSELPDQLSGQTAEQFTCQQ